MILRERSYMPPSAAGADAGVFFIQRSHISIVINHVAGR